MNKNVVEVGRTAAKSEHIERPENGNEVKYHSETSFSQKITNWFNDEKIRPLSKVIFL